MNQIIIRPGKEKSAKHRHPWLFSSAILKINGNPEKGGIVEVCDSSGEFLAYGYFNKSSQIALRLLEWNPETIINKEWWIKKIRDSAERRAFFIKSGITNAFRVVYAESDLLPGLIVDRYGDYLSVQFLTAGVDKLKNNITEILMDIFQPKGIYERSDAEIRALEGLPAVKGLLAGEELPDSLKIIENGINIFVNIKSGQKTGFFLDQRNNRKIVSQYAPGRDVLDCFCYSGGFSLYCLKDGGKNVVSIDSSSEAIISLKQNLLLNQIEPVSENIIEGDVFQKLRQFRDENRKFDMVILDPPKFAPTKKSLDRALRAYKDINLLAMKILRPEGILATFSCSGGVSMEDFRKVIGWSGMDASREVQIIKVLSQAEDHPIRVSYPESEYLKGYICRII